MEWGGEAMIRKGTLVRLKRGLRKGPVKTAKVIRFLLDIGGVELDERLADFRYWNIQDLERADKTEEPKCT